MEGEGRSWDDEFQQAQQQASTSTSNSREWISQGQVLALRSLSLDAQVLDQKIVDQLRSELAKATSLLNPRRVLALQPEIRLVLELALSLLTIGFNKPTPGMQILSIKHVASGGRGGDQGHKGGLSVAQRLMLCAAGPGSNYISQRVR